MHKFLIFFATTFLVACNNSENNSKETNPSPEQQLIGEWNNLSIKIDINSKNNSDTNEVFEVDRPQWEEKLKIKPIRSFFRTDSIWNSAHYNLKDSLVYDPSGKWWVADGKLTMLQSLPSADTTIYNYSIKSDTATFEALVDWDMDGKKDDKYFGRQVKVKQ
jgi:hypothetical protein